MSQRSWSRAASYRTLTMSCSVLALVALGANDASARHRHSRHHEAPPAAADAASGRISPNPRTASMRRSEEALKSALNADPVASAARTPGALRDPKLRAQVIANLAAAPLPRADLAGVRHRDGGAGWVGPVFWPFASYDLVDAALWGDATDASLWSYGVGDLVNGLFGIYPDDDITAYARYLPASTASAAEPSLLSRMCGEAKRGDIAGVPVDTVRSSLALDDAQRGSLDQLAGALSSAEDQVAQSCPDTLPLSAQQRLAAIGQRLDAMIAASDAIAPKLADFYGKLNDSQKTQFVQLGAAAPVNSPPPQPSPQTASTPAPAMPTAAAQACAAAQAVPAWPKDELARAVGRGDSQTKAIALLQGAVGKAQADFAGSCQPADATTPPARLAAIRARLVALRTALGTISDALTPVYAALDPVQTVDLDTVGSAPARGLELAAAAQRYRMLQQAAMRMRPATRQAPIEAADTSAAKPDATKQADAAPPHRGSGRRHLVRSARHTPGPVHAITRVIGSLLP